MAPPVLSDMQYQFLDDGVLLNELWSGSSTLIDVTNIDGLDTPDVRQILEDRDGAHGGFVFSQYMRQRSLALDMIVYAPGGSMESVLDLLKKNFAPRPDDAPFYFKWPGQSQRLIYGKPQGLKYKIDASRSLGIQTCSVQIICADPRAYTSEAFSSIGTWPAIVSQGRTYPKVFPYSYGANTVGGNFNLNNTGTVEMYPVFTISGSVTAPTITNSTTGQSFTIADSTGSPYATIIDMAAARITENGQDVTYKVADGAKWLYLAPGSNNIVFSANAAAGGATLSVDYRSAYL